MHDLLVLMLNRDPEPVTVHLSAVLSKVSNGSFPDSQTDLPLIAGALAGIFAPIDEGNALLRSVRLTTPSELRLAVAVVMRAPAVIPQLAREMVDRARARASAPGYVGVPAEYFTALLEGLALLIVPHSDAERIGLLLLLLHLRCHLLDVDLGAMVAAIDAGVRGELMLPPEQIGDPSPRSGAA